MKEVSPKFLVTKVDSVGQPSRASSYGDDSTTDYFHIGMIHGYYKDTKLDWYFENQAQADRFSLWELYDPSQLINKLGQKDSYRVVSTDKFKGYGQKNAYTDRRAEQEMWRVSMVGNLDDRRLDMTMLAPQTPNKAQMNQGAVVTTQDLFGTLQTMPASVASQLADLAAQASAAEQARIEAQAAADAAAAAAAALEAQIQAALAAQAAAQAAATQAAIDRLAAQAAAYKAQQAAAAASAAQATQQASLAAAAAQRNYLLPHLQNRDDHLYQITHGGAMGWYNGVFFQSGQFADPAHPFNGQWFGTFNPVWNGVPLGSTQYLR